MRPQGIKGIGEMCDPVSPTRRPSGIVALGPSEALQLKKRRKQPVVAFSYQTLSKDDIRPCNCSGDIDYMKKDELQICLVDALLKLEQANLALIASVGDYTEEYAEHLADARAELIATEKERYAKERKEKGK